MFYPKAVHFRELSSHFKNTNNLKGTDSQTGKIDSEEKSKYNISQETEYRCGFSKEKEHTYARQNHTGQHEETHTATSRLYHWCVVIIIKKAKYSNKENNLEYSRDHDNDGGDFCELRIDNRTCLTCCKEKPISHQKKRTSACECVFNTCS